jgi:Zn-dependent protease
VFAAPGAVVIMGRVTKAKYGRIALAGPMTNIVLAVALIGLSFVYSGEFYSKVISLGLLVNLWLAVFNMLPFWILDGKKIFTWNKQVYFATFAFIILLFIVKRFLPGILTVAQIIG